MLRLLRSCVNGLITRKTLTVRLLRMVWSIASITPVARPLLRCVLHGLGAASRNARRNARHDALFVSMRHRVYKPSQNN